MPSILVVAQCENADNIRRQIDKQTIQPDYEFIYVDETPAIGINGRRVKIAENHKLLREAVAAVDCDLVWQIEGDVDLPENALERLVGHYLANDPKTIGFVSGIQVGRHGIYCLGAWVDITDDSFSSIDHTLTGLQPVEATGFYCLLASKKVWLSGKAAWFDEPYGPDVVFGRSIKRRKYVDMGLHVGHIVKGGVIRPSDISTCTVHFYKTDKGHWEYKTT